MPRLAVFEGYGLSRRPKVRGAKRRANAQARKFERLAKQCKLELGKKPSFKEMGACMSRKLRRG